LQTIGEIIRSKREELGFLLRQVAAKIDIDQAILSKIERNERKPTKNQILKLADCLEIEKDYLLIQFMSEKIAYELLNEACANLVLEAAEQKNNYLRSNYDNLKNENYLFAKGKH
jgi:transcriptional regulator with XRE-family HTH domain